MPRKTIVGLEAEIATLRQAVNNLQTQLDKVKTENNLLVKHLEITQRHVNCMTVGNERLADALSHTIGFISDRSRNVRGLIKTVEGR